MAVGDEILEIEVLTDEIVENEDNDSDPESEDEATGGDEEGEGGDDGDQGEEDEDEEEEEEEDLVDPLEEIKTTCADTPGCSKLRLEMESCNDRVNGRSQTDETCVQELFDFIECQDKCVASRLFASLK